MKIIAALFEPQKMHTYVVKTKGKHPVRIIEYGKYITEDMQVVLDESSDLGVFWLNKKEYEYFKSQLKEIEI